MPTLKDKTNLSTYNRIAKIYTEKHFSIDHEAEYVELFLKHLDKGTEILDLGCGPGQFSKYFSEKGYKVTGIDFSESMIEIAKEKAPKANIIHEDILIYKYPDLNYSGIWANAVFLHLTSNQLHRMLNKATKALKPNGVLFMSFIEGKGRRKFERIDRGVEDKRFFYDRSEEEIKELVRSIGLKILNCSRDSSGPVTFISFLLQK